MKKPAAPPDEESIIIPSFDFSPLLNHTDIVVGLVFSLTELLTLIKSLIPSKIIEPLNLPLALNSAPIVVPLFWLPLQSYTPVCVLFSNVVSLLKWNNKTFPLMFMPRWNVPLLSLSLAWKFGSSNPYGTSVCHDIFVQFACAPASNIWDSY